MSYKAEIQAQITGHFNEAKRARDQARQEARDHQSALTEIADTMTRLGMEVPDTAETFPVGHVYGPDDESGDGDIASGVHPSQ